MKSEIREALAPIRAVCAVYSDNMQHGQVIDRTLTIRNPFKVG